MSPSCRLVLEVCSCIQLFITRELYRKIIISPINFLRFKIFFFSTPPTADSYTNKFVTVKRMSDFSCCKFFHSLLSHWEWMIDKTADVPTTGTLGNTLIFLLFSTKIFRYNLLLSSHSYDYIVGCDRDAFCAKTTKNNKRSRNFGRTSKTL